MVFFVDVVVVTKDPEVRIYEYQEGLRTQGDEQTKEVDGSQGLVLKKRQTLLLQTRVGARRQPAALAAGYLDLADSPTPRKMFVVVLTQGWDIICLDSGLNVMWEASVSKKIPDGYFIRSGHPVASLFAGISPLSVV